MRKFDLKKRQRLRARNAERTVQKLNDLRPSLDELGDKQKELVERIRKLKENTEPFRRVLDGLGRLLDDLGRESERLTKRLAALHEPLIRYHEWKRGELADITPYEENAFQDPIAFWVHWLDGIALVLLYVEPIRYSREWEALLEPIHTLRQLLEDLQNGAHSELIDRFIEARKTGKGGRSADPPIVSRHKLGVGLCFRLLSSVALRKRSRAVKIAKQYLKERGLTIGASEIPNLAPKSDAAFPDGMDHLAEYEGLLGLFLDQFRSYLLKKTKVYDDPNLKNMIESAILDAKKISPSEWKRRYKIFVRNNWKIINRKTRDELFNAWAYAPKDSCDHILYYSSRTEELRRFEYTTKT